MSKTEILEALKRRNIDPYIEAVKAFQRSVGLKPDGIVGPMTTRALFPPKAISEGNIGFSQASLNVLGELYGPLRTVLLDARAVVAFELLDGQRGRAEQEKAFKGGFSKVHYGNSAHNWTPALSVDFIPAGQFNWNDLAPFKHIGAIIMECARARGTNLRWLGDPNGDGRTSDGWDWGHVEMHPWRDYKKFVKPYKA